MNDSDHQCLKDALDKAKILIKYSNNAQCMHMHVLAIYNGNFLL